MEQSSIFEAEAVDNLDLEANSPNEKEEQDEVPLRPDFYLKTLRVTGFRALEDATFSFQPTLNVLIGANNSGKTAAIDALRIILNLGSFQEKEDLIRLKPSDICRSVPQEDAASISFEATFHGLDDDDIAAKFYDMDANTEVDSGYRQFNLRYAVQFKRDKSTTEYRYAGSQVTGGEHFQNMVSQETLDYVKSIYLAPLRDVVNDGNRLGKEIERLLHGHGSPEELRSIPGKVRNVTENLISDATSNGHETAAGKTLSKYASTYGIPEDSIKFIPSGLDSDMLRSLQIVFKHGHHGPDGLGLGSNGLGMNNLIYASIVLSRNDAVSPQGHHRFLLIEEPEAHLHPQSQETFFQELNEVTGHQIFVTSHSPTITAKCDLEKVIVMGHPCEDKKYEPCHLAEILKDHASDKRYLHKFLDVTRSQLLFANGAIFVEGVTEAMLLQTFSEALGCSLRASGVEIVILDSNQGFDHFKIIVKGLGMKCAFLTDGDQKPDDLPSDRSELIEAAKNVTFETDESVRTYRNVGTFEFELLLASLSEKDEFMRNLLRSSMTAVRGAKTDETNEAFGKDFMDFDAPDLAYRRMKQKKESYEFVAKEQWHGDARTNAEFTAGKSEFAYLVLQGIMEALPAANFKVPDYIAHAIKYVTTRNPEPIPPDEAPSDQTSESPEP